MVHILSVRRLAPSLFLLLQLLPALIDARFVHIVKAGKDVTLLQQIAHKPGEPSNTPVDKLSFPVGDDGKLIVDNKINLSLAFETSKIHVNPAEWQVIRPNCHISGALVGTEDVTFTITDITIDTRDYLHPCFYKQGIMIECGPANGATCLT